MSNTLINFIAATDNQSIVETGIFFKVISSSPSDCADLIQNSISKNDKITVASFGPTVKTTKSYIFGSSSVLSQILSFYVDAQIPVKLFIQNSQTRLPEGDNTFFPVTSASDFSPLFEKTDLFPENDYIKISLFIDQKVIVFLYIPSFPPFMSSAQLSVKLNGWNFLQEPSSLIHTFSFVILHLDENLPTETQALQILASCKPQIQEKDIPIPENIVQLRQLTPDELREQQSSMSQASRRSNAPRNNRPGDEDDSLRSPGNEDGKKMGKHRHHHRHHQKPGEVNNDENPERRHRRRHNKNKDAPSGDDHANNDKNSTAVSRGPMRESELEDDYSYESGDEDTNANNADQRRRVKRTKRVRKDDPRYSQYIVSKNGQNGDRIINFRKGQGINSLASDDSYEYDYDSDGKHIIRKRAHKAIEANEGYYSDYDYYSSELYSDNDNQEMEEETLEERIHNFAFSVEFNVPALQDTAIYSTLFRQLFFEKWKGGAMKRAENALNDVKEHIRKQRADETANLRALVQSGDLTVFIAREEQKLRLVEAKTVETIEQLMNHQIEQYQGTNMQSLYKNFKILCAQQIEQERILRQRRAEIRSKAMDMRMSKMKRLEKMERKQKKEQKLKEQKDRLTLALQKQNSLEAEVDGLVDARNDLLAQKEKVMAILSQKKAKKTKSSTSIKQ